MRLAEGVEWGVHSCLALSWLEDEAPIPAARLADIHDLPVAYLAKQMQALARAGIVSSTSGARGGFRLARPIREISLLDVVDAIEGGRAVTFECTEIRRRGPVGQVSDSSFSAPCGIAAAMRRAEDNWRAALKHTSLAEIGREVLAAAPGTADATRVWFAQSRNPVRN